MGKHAVVVIGPAGSGKSTLCNVLSEHYSAIGRTVHVCNFDPAADELIYTPSMDIRELIDVDDAMEGKGLGPNGGMIFCLEYLIENPQWLYEQLGEFSDDFMIVDMPGQIELTSHIPVVPRFVQMLQQSGYNVVVCFVLDAVAATADAGKFISGCLMSVSSMVCFDCPYINAFMKCDMLPAEFKEDDFEHYCLCDFDHLKLGHLTPRWRNLSRTFSSIINDFNLVSFKPVDVSNTDFISNFATLLDDLTQYTEDAEVKDRDIELDE